MLAGPGAEAFQVKADQNLDSLVAGDVIVSNGHAMASLGGDIIEEASWTEHWVITVDLSRATDPSYEHHKQAQLLLKDFNDAHTVYQVKW
jgi:hypothetical protein